MTDPPPARPVPPPPRTVRETAGNTVIWRCTFCAQAVTVSEDVDDPGDCPRCDSEMRCKRSIVDEAMPVPAGSGDEGQAREGETS